MKIVLSLLLVNVVLGAWDTIWYHEIKAKLPYCLASTRPELRLHAMRDAVYAVLYGVLAWRTPTGWWVPVIGVLVAAEVAITLCDFVVEDRDRAAIGGMVPGERILHTLMAIVYGAMLCRLVPIFVENAALDTGFVISAIPTAYRWAATAAAVGIALSGIRDAMILRGHDLLAVFGFAKLTAYVRA
jgi:hypothetical protein